MLNAASWNVFGLGHSFRLRRVNQWARNRCKNLQVLMLQELRKIESKTNLCLRQLAQGGTYMVDYLPEKKTGVTLIFKKNWHILAHGVRGDGTAVWAKVITEEGEFGFAVVHEVVDKTQSTHFPTCRVGKWILGGDWNSVDPLRTVEEYRRCRGGQNKESGPHWQERWIWRTAGQKQHNEADPTSQDKSKLEKRREGSMQKTTYFKTSPEILRREGTRTEMKKWWDEARNGSEDASVRCELKWSTTRSYLKELHREEQQTRREVHVKLDELRKKLKEAARVCKKEAYKELTRTRRGS
ncbi:hypothetical protein R1sor_018314 [Riccia sorocarpa]|uniref:Endonuclease/exonuclease/phosphatase domain-containing protein n=1 Tax=Riccia sorocarpa TaxID=122646 RepID=A0ABD3I9H0_9MARC